MAKPRILAIVGPTASGKSALAVKLARKFNGEIISADSRQVYKGLNVGTGKITKKEMGGVPHHLLDVANPKKQFTASNYKKLARNSLKHIVMNSKLPIVVGGTGFYIDALTGASNFPDVPPNQALRAKLAKKSAGELFKILMEKDPRRARAIDPHNKVRLIRALEIIDSIGKVPPVRQDFTRQAGNKFIFIGLKPDNLDQRIRLRLKQRLEPIIREGRKLHEQGLTYKRMNELGLEYRYLSMYLQGKISKNEMFEKLYIEIKRYARRQMTWFKRNKKIKWFKQGEEAEIQREITKFLH